MEVSYICSKPDRAAQGIWVDEMLDEIDVGDEVFIKHHKGNRIIPQYVQVIHLKTDKDWWIYPDQVATEEV